MGLPFDRLVPGSTGADCDTSAIVVMTDPSGRVTCCSPAVQQLLGYASAEVIGRPVAELLSDDRFRGREGREPSVQVRLCSLRDGEREVGYALTAVTTGQSDAPTESADVREGETLMRREFDQYPIALVIYDRDGRLLRINEKMAEVIGRPEDEVRGLRLTEQLQGPTFEDAELRILRVVETGEPDYMEHEVSTPPGSKPHPWAVDMFPLKDAAGKVCAVSLAVYDYTQQHYSRQRLELLGEARTRIGTTLDVTGAARELAEVAVPRFADVVTVDLFDAVFQGEQPDPVLPGRGAALRRAANLSVYERADEAALAVGQSQVHPPASPVTRVLITGRAELHAITDPEIVGWLADDPVRADLCRRHGAHSLITVPIRARGTTLGGVMFLRHAACPEPFSPEDLAFAEDLVSRVALHVDNARRYTRERGIALALQRALLPPSQISHAAVEMAARYLPSGGDAEVGGDWFDVIPLPGARVGLVVGDVVGHGISASATMGRLRTAVRTLADVDLPPDELLTHLDDIVTHAAYEREAESPESAGAVGELSGDVGASCLYAIYDPVSRTFSMARAGHPAPILVQPDGTAHILDLPAGPPLGLGSLPFEATDLTVPEGSMLALFTDGLLETREQDIDERLDTLCRVLACPVTSLEAACDTVLEALRTESQADDIALLIARTRTLDQDHVASWDITADPAVVAHARKHATDCLTTWGLEESIFVTELVVSELVTNAIRHAADPIRLRLIKDQSLICEVSDGSSTSPHLRRARLSDEGGRGLFLVAELTERWGTRHTHNGKVIWAEQRLAPTL
ncbi:SpoIIE family protein phosphatase [Streptomyces sp. UG1]|uniref:SpoIIE family protein phosphatase n=1 Tax=Streptomyces sp. UG1 TaxID=3417652 RepID=UPI003CF157FC